MISTQSNTAPGLIDGEYVTSGESGTIEALDPRAVRFQVRSLKESTRDARDRVCMGVGGMTH